MSDDFTRDDERTGAPGRILYVEVFGDTADEIELAALDRAREFFGPGPQLAVIPAYRVLGIDRTGSPEAQESGKLYRAGVDVRTVES